MKHIIFATALGLSIALCPQTWAGGSEFKPLPEAPKSGDEEFFKATDGEAKIEGHVVKLFVVKPDYLTASYKNESKKALSPEYTVRTYNRYGYLLSSAKVQVSMFGGSPRLEIGDVGAIRIRMQAYTGDAGQSLEKVDGKPPSHVLLDLDFWALMPK